MAQAIAFDREGHPSSSTTPLAAKISKSDRDTLRTTARVPSGGSDFALLDIPVSTFQIKARVDANFRQFLRDYHVCADADSSLRFTSDDGREHEEFDEEGGSSPRWMLVAKRLN